MPNVESVSLRSVIPKTLSGTLIPDANFERLRSLSVDTLSADGHALSKSDLFTIFPRTFFDKQMLLVELQLFSASMLDPNRVTPPSTLKALDVWGTSLDPSEDLYRGGRFSSLVVLRLQIMASCPHDTWEYFIRGLPNLKCLEISRELFHTRVPAMSESIDLDFFGNLQKDIIEYRLHFKLPLPLNAHEIEICVSIERLVGH